MDESARQLKARLDEALTHAQISHGRAAELLYGSERHRTKVREYLREDRTVPAEFVAGVARLTGLSGHWLLCGEGPRHPSQAGIDEMAMQVVAELVDGWRETKRRLATSSPGDADVPLEAYTQEDARRALFGPRHMPSSGRADSDDADHRPDAA